MRLALNFTRVDPDRGGAETYIVDLCRRLIDAGHEVSLFANAWRDGALPPEVRCVRVPMTGWTKAQRIKSFATNSESALKGDDHDCSVGFINTWAHDVIVPQGGVYPASLEANSRRYPAGWRRRLYLAGKALSPTAPLYRAIERKQYDPARRAHVVAVSKMVRGHLGRFYRVPDERIRVIPNAIDASRLEVPDKDKATVRTAFRSKLGLESSDLAILFVGHNYRLKGLGPLLDALAYRLARNPSTRPIHLIACGGRDVAPFDAKAKALGLAATTHLLGFVPSIRDAFHAADAFVLPSYYDPCSLVVLEALAAGLPSITTECNGAGELITPGREGFVVPNPDAREELADALDAMTDDGRRGAMAVAAVELGRAQSMDRHVASLLGLFAEVAAEKRRPARSRRPATEAARS